MYIIISTVLDILGIMTTIYKEYILLLSPLSQGRQKCFGGCTRICHGWQISKGNKAKNGRKVPNETKYFNVFMAIEEGLCRPWIKIVYPRPSCCSVWVRDVCRSTGQQCVLTGCLLQVVGEDVSGPPGRVQQHGGGAGRGGGRGGLPLPIQVHGETHTWYLTHHLSWILLAFLSKYVVKHKSAKLLMT